jgi:hypothetical protein
MRPVVPSLAVQYDRSGAYVWKVEGNVVHRIGVDIVGRRSGTVVVVADLEPGDFVVSEGLQRLREGSRVSLVGDSAPAPAGVQAPTAAIEPGGASPPANAVEGTTGQRPRRAPGAGGTAAPGAGGFTGRDGGTPGSGATNGLGRGGAPALAAPAPAASGAALPVPAEQAQR